VRRMVAIHFEVNVMSPWTRSTHRLPSACFFSLSDPPTSGTYPLSLHDALPISAHRALRLLERAGAPLHPARRQGRHGHLRHGRADRKSTRLNSSHVKNSYAVFCSKKKTMGLMITSQSPNPYISSFLPARAAHPP